MVFGSSSNELKGSSTNEAGIFVLIPPQYTGQLPNYNSELQQFDYTQLKIDCREKFHDYLKNVKKYLYIVKVFPPELITEKVVNNTAWYMCNSTRKESIKPKSESSTPVLSGYSENKKIINAANVLQNKKIETPLSSVTTASTVANSSAILQSNSVVTLDPILLKEFSDIADKISINGDLRPHLPAAVSALIKLEIDAKSKKSNIVSVPVNSELNYQQSLFNKEVPILTPPKFTGQRPFYNQKTHAYDYTYPRPCPRAPFEEYLKKVERFIHDKIKLPPERIKPTDVNKTAWEFYNKAKKKPINKKLEIFDKSSLNATIDSREINKIKTPSQVIEPAIFKQESKKDINKTSITVYWLLNYRGLDPVYDKKLQSYSYPD
jgi:hypothetical protein